MSMKRGSQTAVRTCMGIKKDDIVTIVSDDQSKKIGEFILEETNSITSAVDFFNLDDFGERPLNEIPSDLERYALESTATFWTAKSVRGELKTVRMPFFKAAVKGGRHAHMVGITEKIFKKGLSCDYNKIESFTKSVKGLLDKATELRIKSDLGTDLVARVDKYKWIASTGVINDIGNWHNLPDGEVFTAPYGLEGTAVIDGTLGDYFDNIYSPEDTEKDPLTLNIKNKKRPKLVGISGGNEEMVKKFEQYVDQHENSRYVGEIGIGTNLFVDKLMGNMLIDEKYPGVHIAFGDPNGHMTGADWQCPTHIDLIMKNCSIWVDGILLMKEGKYQNIALKEF